jgi:hypothetical protein
MLGKLFGLLGAGGGEAIAKPIDALGNVFDKLFTSDAERAQAQAVLEKLRQYPAELQVELNKIEAAHRSIFVAGWRPFIGWVGGVSLGCYYIPQFVMASIIWTRQSWALGSLVPYPVTEISGLTELVIALLGLAGLRTYEKREGVTK